MKDRDFSNSERPNIKYIPDLELTQIYQRNKEVYLIIY